MLNANDFKLASREKNKDEIEYIAQAQAKADPSDPFVYNRVYSELMQGLGDTINDYDVSFKEESRSYTSENGEEKTYSVEVPYNRKRI